MLSQKHSFLLLNLQNLVHVFFHILLIYFHLFFFLPSVGNHPNAQWKSDETNHGILLSNKEEGCTIDPGLDEMQGNYAKWKNRPRKDAYYPTSSRNSHEITCL